MKPASNIVCILCGIPWHYKATVLSIWAEDDLCEVLLRLLCNLALLIDLPTTKAYFSRLLLVSFWMDERKLKKIPTFSMQASKVFPLSPKIFIGDNKK